MDKLPSKRAQGLTLAEEAVCHLLEKEKDLFGLEIAKRSDNRVSANSIYGVLSRLEADGIVSSTREQLPEDAPWAIPRRFYQLTKHGSEVLAATRKLRELRPPIEQENSPWIPALG